LAILEALPEEAIISGFKGIIDYYVWRGLPCARSWPTYPKSHQQPGSRAQWPIFSDAVKEWSLLDSYVRNAYKSMASGSTLSGRDMMVKMYINSSSILPY